MVDSHDKKMSLFIKKVKTMCWFVLSLLLIVCVACGTNDNNIGNGNGNGSGNGNGNEDNNYELVFRYDDFLVASNIDVLIDGKIATKTDVYGVGYITSNLSYDQIVVNIRVKGYTCYVLINYELNSLDMSPILEVVLSDSNELFLVSGKIVQHYGGEQVEKGVDLKIDGVLCFNSNIDRNFSFIAKVNCTISAYKDGYEFVDASEIPDNDKHFTKDVVDAAQSTVVVVVNGVATTIKSIGGVTFRAKHI